MALDPRIAMQQFVASIERHFEAVSSRQDPAIEQSFYQLEDAFLNYEEALGEKFGEDLPMSLAEEESD
ncbi:MAG: hypothetical protein ACKOWH_01435 [Rhodoluna sp.]